MFDSLRLFVLSSLYYFGFTYAAFTALKQRVTSEEIASPTALSPTEHAPPRRTKILLGLPALKLMIMLTTMALLSLLGAELFPLFAEMRVIFMYTLLFSPPFTQQELYDQLFAPLLVHGGTFALSLQTSNFLSRKVPLFVVRRCVDVGIAAMNFTQRHHALDEAAVRDILSGLVFSQRALQQAAELSRDADGATYTQIARDSNFAVGVFASHVKRALLSEQEADEFDARAPTRGRVVPETGALWQAELSTATAAASSWSASPSESSTYGGGGSSSGGGYGALGGSGGRPDGLVESLRSERDFHAAEDRRTPADRAGREKRKRHKLFGLF